MKADQIWHENIFRLRSLHVEGPRPAGTLRIAALGDSFTWGDKIPRTEDLWPSVLERSLAENGRPTHVINLGQNGYTTVNEAETLRRIGWRFDPHIVLLQFTLNDPLPSRPGFWSERERWLFPTWPLIPPLDEKLRANSYLYAWLNDSFVSLQMAWRHPDGYAPLFDDGFHGWRDCRLALQEMADETRRRGVPMLMVLFPIFHQGDLDEQSYPNLDLHRKVEAAAREAGLPCLDLRPVFAREDPHSLRWRAFPWDGHPGVDAHRLAGRAVAAELERLALIPSPREPE
jgi:hypothetical protein